MPIGTGRWYPARRTSTAAATSAAPRASPKVRPGTGLRAADQAPCHSASSCGPAAIASARPCLSALLSTCAMRTSWVSSPARASSRSDHLGCNRISLSTADNTSRPTRATWRSLGARCGSWRALRSSRSCERMVANTTIRLLSMSSARSVWVSPPIPRYRSKSSSHSTLGRC